METVVDIERLRALSKVFREEKDNIEEVIAHLDKEINRIIEKTRHEYPEYEVRRQVDHLKDCMRNVIIEKNKLCGRIENCERMIKTAASQYQASEDAALKAIRMQTPMKSPMNYKFDMPPPSHKDAPVYEWLNDYGPMRAMASGVQKVIQTVEESNFDVYRFDQHVDRGIKSGVTGFYNWVTDYGPIKDGIGTVVFLNELGKAMEGDPESIEKFAHESIQNAASLEQFKSLDIYEKSEAISEVITFGLLGELAGRILFKGKNAPKDGTEMTIDRAGNLDEVMTSIDKGNTVNVNKLKTVIIPKDEFKKIYETLKVTDSSDFDSQFIKFDDSFKGACKLDDLLKTLNFRTLNLTQLIDIVKKSPEIGRELISKISKEFGISIKANPLRQAYENEVKNLSELAKTLNAQGNSEEAIARQLSQMRRDLGIKYKDLSPQLLKEYIYDVNLARYKDTLGPTIEFLRNKGKSWDEIIEGTCRPNPDVDKLLGDFEQWMITKSGL